MSLSMNQQKLSEMKHKAKTEYINKSKKEKKNRKKKKTTENNLKELGKIQMV